MKVDVKDLAFGLLPAGATYNTRFSLYCNDQDPI
jgi:hypothetical protein